MKRSIIAAILLVGMVHSAASLLAQTSTTRSTAKKKAKKKSRIRPAPPVDPTEGDNVDGDDLEIRRAAVAAIGTMNGSVLVADPTSGRILAMVNQKLALKSGFIPCSTIKLVTALAALSEHVVTRERWSPSPAACSYQPHHRAGALQQPVFRSARHPPGLQPRGALRAVARAGGKGGPRYSRRAGRRRFPRSLPAAAAWA